MRPIHGQERHIHWYRIAPELNTTVQKHKSTHHETCALSIELEREQPPLLLCTHLRFFFMALVTERAFTSTVKSGTHCKYASARPLVPRYDWKESSTFIVWTSLVRHCIYHISPQGRVTPVVGLLAKPRRVFHVAS